VSEIPATAVGRAKGKSIKPSTSFLPQKSYLSKTHARRSPKTTFIAAAKKDVPKDILSEASTLSEETISQNLSRPIGHCLGKPLTQGLNQQVRYVRVNPMAWD